MEAMPWDEHSGDATFESDDDLDSRERCLLERLAKVREELAAHGETPLDELIDLEAAPNYLRWIEQAILQQLADLRASPGEEVSIESLIFGEPARGASSKAAAAPSAPGASSASRELELLRSVLAQSPFPVALIDMEQRQLLLEVNFDRVLRARVFPRGSVGREPPPGWTDGAGQPLKHGHWPLWRCLGGEAVPPEVLRMELRGGGARTFRVSGGPALHTHWAVLVWEEITAAFDHERRLAAEAGGSHAVLSEVLSSVPLGVAVHRLGANPPMMNARMRSLAPPALQAERALRRTDGRPYASADLPSARAWRGDAVEENALIVSGDGRVTPLHLSARPVRDRDGAVIHVVETAQEDWGQLGLDDFLADLAHELRTPMTSILGWTRLLTDGDLPPEKHAHGLAIIDRNSRLQMHLIEDLLDTSLLLAGRVRLSPVATKPRAVVERVLESIQPLASRKDITFSVRVVPDDGDVVLDPERLEQLLWNLLANAIKVSHTGSSIRLRVSHLGTWLRLAVQDTGDGLPAAALHLTSEPLGRAAPERRASGGIGLALAMMKRLVHLQGGSIEAHSEGAGKGSTYVASIPAPLARPAPASPSVVSEELDFGESPTAELQDPLGLDELSVGALAPGDGIAERELIPAVEGAAVARVATPAEGVAIENEIS